MTTQSLEGTNLRQLSQREDFIDRKLYQLEDIVLKSAKVNNHSAMIGAIKVQVDLAQVTK